ncbi:hypothetical protein SANT12839_080880 [Streptomyces antimycoticus]|uniref:Uncharacterized protein n=1 Tax=Streptomyces antimycoticus TaxID=68175 RepID=A0A4D4KK65_9ACTN|nr:hypothetical protein SANT12839_080880 [Streptomyces antimycoticus]
MSENHEAIVVDAKTEEAGAARSRTSALRIRLRGAATVSGGRSGSI